MTDTRQAIQDSVFKGLIDGTALAAENYQPSLLMNDQKKEQYVIQTLQQELASCREFFFSVAFVTEGGLDFIKTQLADLAAKGIKGKLVTSNYLNFNTPKIFRALLKIPNLEVRMTNQSGFHAKGYLFTHKKYHSIIIGSSNLTMTALKVNYEWNVKLTSYEQGELIQDIEQKMTAIWETSVPLTEAWIQAYQENYHPMIPADHFERPIFGEVAVPNELTDEFADYRIKEQAEIQPNKMQQKALAALNELREKGERRALVISATGTGKTFLAAFDVKNAQPKKMLFIVHREQILKKALTDFQRILGGDERDYGLFSGNHKQTEAKYVFATIQTLAKDENLQKYARKHFDYILVDEVHKSGAATYLKVLDYFTPRFLLGMTATPERMDHFNIFELFDYNIAYEIRLQEALEEDMLCPFHYFGVTDYERDGETISETSDLKDLVSQERVRYILEKLAYYGHSGDQVKGLIFCSRKEEACELSGLLNQKELRTSYLVGNHGIEEREQEVARLEKGELDYLITVDIFNEGIDIPCINQIVMLRQTQSSIIFIQQLGRGLRKNKNKDFVTIIDFIGNYKNNYLIPLALSGDTSRDKNNLRKSTMDQNFIAGVTAINFEQVAKERIFSAISAAGLTDFKVLKDTFAELKNRLNRVPLLQDFFEQHSIDPAIMATAKTKNYYEFLQRVKDNESILTKDEQAILTMLSNELLNGKRQHELILLQELITNEELPLNELSQLFKTHQLYIRETTVESVLNILNYEFFTAGDREKYGHTGLITTNGNIRLTPLFQRALGENNYFKKLVEDVIVTGLKKAEKYQSDEPLCLYEKYTRKDVCRLLEWQKDEHSTIYGYKVKHQTCPIFITYEKHEDVDASVNYQDELLDRDTLKWYTRSRRKLISDEVVKILEAKQRQIAIHLFVKKDDDEGNDFYYLGEADVLSETARQEEMQDKEGTTIPVVSMKMKINPSVENKLYQYLQEE